MIYQTFVAHKAIWILLVVYQLKHWVCDYPLQTEFMLGKFKKEGWVPPLAAHAGVHALFTYGIATIYLAFNSWLPAVLLMPVVLLFAGFDFVVHFTMDRIKASPKLMGRWKALSAGEYRTFTGELARGNSSNPEIKLFQNFAREKLRGNKYFWWALGVDQKIHHLTHYVIIFALLALS